MVAAMKLVMTLLCRDEDDILDANLRFHLEQGVDYIIAMNNLSVDGTGGILEAYERAGVLTLINQEKNTYDQDRWVTQMARMAKEVHGADWVINNDGDEFWWPRQGTLKDVLAALPPSIEMVRVPRHNFLPAQFDTGQFHERMRIREAGSRNSFGEPLPPKACHRGFVDIDVAFGNHFAKRGDLALREIDGPPMIEILHFPLRTYAQFERKITVGGAALEKNIRLDKAIGSNWRRLLKEHNCGRLYEYYQLQILGPAAVEDRLRSGTLVQDDRLYHFFSRLDVDRQTRPWTDGRSDSRPLAAVCRVDSLLAS
jgi:hypothetical protein